MTYLGVIKVDTWLFESHVSDMQTCQNHNPKNKCEINTFINAFEQDFIKFYHVSKHFCVK